MDDLTVKLLALAAALCAIVALQGAFGCMEERRRKRREQDRRNDNE